jgi:hypothetical protein
MDPLAVLLEDRRDRMLREPIDLEVGMEVAKRVGDRDIALGVTKADGR